MKTRKNTLYTSYFSLFTGLSFMCFAAILVKASHAPGIVTAFYRMAIGAVTLLFPFVYHTFSNKPSLPLKGIILAVAAGFCFGFDMAFWSTGVVASNATVPTLFANMAPVWVGIGTFLIFKEKHSKGFWIGLILTITGILLLVKEDLFVSSNIIKGAVLGFTAGIFYGSFYLFAQSGRKRLDTLSFLFISTLSSSVVLTICILIFNYDFFGYDRFTYKIFIAFGLGVQVIGWLFINYSQGYIPASIVAPTLLGQPVLTAVLAVPLLHEHLTFWHISGGIVIVTGIYIVHFYRNKKVL